MVTAMRGNAFRKRWPQGKPPACVGRKAVGRGLPDTLDPPTPKSWTYNGMLLYCALPNSGGGMEDRLETPALPKTKPLNHTDQTNHSKPRKLLSLSPLVRGLRGQKPAGADKFIVSQAQDHN